MFQWIPVENAVKYTLNIFDNSTRTNIIFSFNLDCNGEIIQRIISKNKTGDNNLVYNIQNLNPQTTYFYSLSSYDINNNALTSSIGDFSTLKTTLNENFKNTVSIYPKIISESVLIKGLNRNEIVNIYSIYGINVFSKTIDDNSINIDLSNLCSGIYILKVGNCFSERIIKK